LYKRDLYRIKELLETMSTNRKDLRNQSYAKVLLNGKFPGYIRDTSPEGFRVYSPMLLPVKEGDEVQCIVIPTDGEEETFKISGQVRWNRQDQEGENIIGILITAYKDSHGKDLYKKLDKQFSNES
jgi:hypothetical protein